MIYDKYVDLKNKYLEYIILIKVGNFYHSYDDDGIILNYLFNYKIKDNSIVGFPVSSLDKVKRRLKKENINFIGIRKNKKFTNYHRTVKKVKKRIGQYYDKKQELSSVISSINYIKGRKL